MARRCFAQAHIAYFSEFMKRLQVESSDETVAAMAGGFADRTDRGDRQAVFSNMMAPFPKAFSACARAAPSIRLKSMDWRIQVDRLNCEALAAAGWIGPELDAAYVGLCRVPMEETATLERHLGELPNLNAYLKARFLKEGRA